MKTVVGVLMCIAGVVIGLYAGIWWAFIGGIVDVITEIKNVETDAMNVAVGVAKVMMAGAIGGFSALVLLIPGIAMIKTQ